MTAPMDRLANASANELADLEVEAGGKAIARTGMQAGLALALVVVVEDALNLNLAERVRDAWVLIITTAGAGLMNWRRVMARRRLR